MEVRVGELVLLVCQPAPWKSWAQCSSLGPVHALAPTPGFFLVWACSLHEWRCLTGEPKFLKLLLQVKPNFLSLRGWMSEPACLARGRREGEPSSPSSLPHWLLLHCKPHSPRRPTVLGNREPESQSHPNGRPLPSPCCA